MRQFFSFVQALGQFDAADGAGFSVFLPAAAGEVSRARLASILTGVRRLATTARFSTARASLSGKTSVHALAGEVVGHDVREFGKPEVGDLGKDFAFAGMVRAG